MDDNPLTHNPFKNMSKPAKYATAIGGAGIAGYLVYRHHASTGSWNPWSKTATGTSSAGDSTTIDPVTGLAYSQDNVTDPLTGQTYLAEANQYGSVAAAEAAVSAFGGTVGTGSGIGVQPANGGSSGTTVSGAVSASTYTSLAAWVQAATAGLTDIGYNATDVASALGDYATQTPVTAAQKQIIDTAIAEYGQAPGNLQVILAPVTKPSALMISGLRVDKVNEATKGNNGSVEIRWNQTPGATSYKVFMEANGTFNTDSTLANEGKLSPGNHSVMVTPEPNGKASSVSFTVPKSKTWKE